MRTRLTRPPQGENGFPRWPGPLGNAGASRLRPRPSRSSGPSKLKARTAGASENHTDVGIPHGRLARSAHAAGGVANRYSDTSPSSAASTSGSGLLSGPAPLRLPGLRGAGRGGAVQRRRASCRLVSAGTQFPSQLCKREFSSAFSAPRVALLSSDYVSTDWSKT